MLASVATLVVLLFPASAPGQETGGKAEAQAEHPQHATTRLVWNRRPSLRIGDVLRVDFRVKLQADALAFPSELQEDRDTFKWGRRRIGVDGTFLRHFEYQIEREFREENPWRDVFVNFRYFRDVQIQAGKFKIPFSLEQLTGAYDLDFVLRSRIADDLASGRDIGVMAHGRFFDRALSYEAGVFEHDGELARFGSNPGAGYTAAGRLRGRPFRPLGRSGLGQLELGFAFTSSEVPEGLNTLRGRTVSGAPVFFDAYVRGRRLRLGTEVNWELGPVGLKGEYIRVRDERREQGLFADDLPPLISQGWYTAGTWVVTGERKAGGVEPRKPFLRGGVGAVEIGVRYERIRFGSDQASEPQETNPRAANLLENGDDVWTFGVNWYLNRWSRIQLNAIREQIEDVERSPISGRPDFWSAIARLQFVL